MTQTEALKLALEALENNKQKHHYCEDTWYSCPKHEEGCANDSEGDECNCGANEINAQFDKAITAIKEALAQPEQERCVGCEACIDTACGRDECPKGWPKAAQPEQEPVAFPRQVGDSTWTVDTAFIWRVKHTIDPDTPHDFTPSEEQIETVLLALEKIPSNLYTTPPQRKPLTDEELRVIENKINPTMRWRSSDEEGITLYPQEYYELVRAIEAAHGIKEQQ